MNQLTLPDLVALDKKTELHQISFALLARYYEEYLMPYTYKFELDNGVVIDLKFGRKDFCHLVGIQQVAKERHKSDVRKGKTKKVVVQMYSGAKGFKRAKEDKIKFSDLSRLHSGYYEKEKRYEKANFFHFLHRMLISSNVSVVKFATVDDSKIECDFLFHDKYDGALLHLGVEKNSDDDVFYPKTFFRYYLTDSKYDKFITAGGAVKIENVIVLGN